MNDSVYISNLPFNTTEEELLAWLNQKGKVIELAMLRNDDMHFAGVAIARMSDTQAAEAMVHAVEGSIFGERTIACKLYAEVANDPSSVKLDSGT